MIRNYLIESIKVSLYNSELIVKMHDQFVKLLRSYIGQATWCYILNVNYIKYPYA